VGGWVAAKEKGLVKNHGKEYVVEDGDYIIILANTK
jgi:ribosome-binding ATPase YchF (GTP1/OBG family)